MRRRVTIELTALAVLTPIFLLYAPRSGTLYIGMALLFLAYIGLHAKETKDKIWGHLRTPGGERLRQSAAILAGVTIPAVLVFVAWGTWKNHDVSYLNLLLALCLYFPWAVLQQTIFQFHLLGRRRTLLQGAPPYVLCGINGILYGLVHLPNGWVTLAGGLVGIVWSYSYYRDRLILPIAVSHAILGTTFYYFVVGHDLFKEMGAYVAGLG